MDVEADMSRSSLSDQKRDEEEVKAYLKRYPDATCKSIAMVCNMTQKQAKGILRRLHADSIRTNNP
jgi:hypothetical protein